MNKPKTSEEILETIRYRKPDTIPNPQSLQTLTLIDGEFYEKVEVQFEFKFLPLANPNDERKLNPKYEECEYEPYILHGETVLRKRIK